MTTVRSAATEPERRRIRHGDAEHEAREAPSRGHRRDDPTRDPDGHDDEPVSQEQSKDLTTRRTERHSHTDFLPALGHALRDHAVDADRCQKNGDDAEDREHDHRDAAATGRLAHHLIDRPVVEDGNGAVEIVDGRLERRTWTPSLACGQSRTPSSAAAGRSA